MQNLPGHRDSGHFVEKKEEAQPIKKEEHERELRHELPDLLRRAVHSEVRRRQEPDGYE